MFASMLRAAAVLALALVLPACGAEDAGDGRAPGEVPVFGEGDCSVEVVSCRCISAPNPLTGEMMGGCFDRDCNDCSDWCDIRCEAEVRFDCAEEPPGVGPLDHRACWPD